MLLLLPHHLRLDGPDGGRGPKRQIEWSNFSLSDAGAGWHSNKPLVATATGWLYGCTLDGRMGACCGFTPSSPGCSAWACWAKSLAQLLATPLRGVTPKGAGEEGACQSVVSLQDYKTLGWLGTLARPRGQVSELSAQRE